MYNSIIYENGNVLSKDDMNNIIKGIDKSLFSTNKYKDKKMSILGDSISTYVGTIPAGNRDYYYGNNLGVTDVSQMWWCIVKDVLGMELLVNDSWAGRCVATTRDNESNMANSAGARDTTVARLKKEDITPDVIFVRLGTNDFSYSTPIGDYTGSSALTSDISTFSSAYANMLKQLITQYPKAEIWCCTIPCARRSASVPSIINGKTILDYNKVILDLCSLNGIHIVRHDLCGINNYTSEYFGDYSSSGGTHPNAAGQRLLAEQCLRDMNV